MKTVCAHYYHNVFSTLLILTTFHSEGKKDQDIDTTTTIRIERMHEDSIEVQKNILLFQVHQLSLFHCDLCFRLLIDCIIGL